MVDNAQVVTALANSLAADNRALQQRIAELTAQNAKLRAVEQAARALAAQRTPIDGWATLETLRATLAALGDRP